MEPPCWGVCAGLRFGSPRCIYPADAAGVLHGSERSAHGEHPGGDPPAHRFVGWAADGLLYRYDPASAPDGLPGREGTFNMCSFWLVEALTRAGRTDPTRLEEARLLFEQMLGYANHLGLYAEQTGNSGEALGNFPQAFTHLALISAAFNLDRMLGAR